MDSLTQLVLGAGVAEAALGKKIGRKASLYGAVLGTLPDLDVLWVKNAVDSFTEHRSFSHSLIVLLLASPLFAWLLRRINPKDLTGNSISLGYWALSVYLVFATHALLDWFTIYGTQLLWPLSSYPFALGSVFIIDPIYTFPFLLCVLITVITRKRIPLYIGLFFSSAYLVSSLFIQSAQHKLFTQDFSQKGIEFKQSVTLAMPFNTLLWKNIAMTDDGYWVSFRSVFDSDDFSPQPQFFKSDNQQLKEALESNSVKKLQYFTKGFYQVKQQDNALWMSDLRMGGFGNFVFNFKVAETEEGQLKAIAPDSVESKHMRGDKNEMKRALGLIQERISDENIDLFPLFDDSEMIVR